MRWDSGVFLNMTQDQVEDNILTLIIEIELLQKRVKVLEETREERVNAALATRISNCGARIASTSIIW